MQNVVLVIHLILALFLIGVVLLQRSEGGGLGIGGGGGVMSARGAATALGKMTWALAIAFIGTSIMLTILAAEQSATGSVIDRLGTEVPMPENTPPVPVPSELTPPVESAPDGGPVVPLVPPRAD